LRTVKLILFLIVAAVVAAIIYIYSSPTVERSAATAPSLQPRTAEVLPSGLVLPVRGVRVEQLSDTWGQSRAGGARAHQAIDIMAPAGAPVVAAMPGRVEKLFVSAQGGITAYVRSLDGKWMTYYAHLQAYDRNLREGAVIKRGDPVGLVGDTGNSGKGNYHLHFAVGRMAPGEQWYQGTPVNPYPILAGKPAAR
jgi:murein DD-endopeptidase MepM/ murein hydrolase activator NlpD